MPTAYETAQLAAPGLVGFWKFAEGAGTTATDSKGTIGDMTYSGSGVTYAQPSLLPGDPTNTCVLMDGTNGRATRASEAALDITAAISFSAWIKPTDVSVTSDRYILYKPNFNWGLSIRSNTVAPGTLRADSHVGIISPPYTIVANNTYFVCGTYDGINAFLYVNGTQVASVSTSGAMTTGATSFEVGSWLNTVHFKGYMQHIALANQAWPLATVQSLYTIGAAAQAVGSQANVFPFSTVVLPANSARTRVTFSNCSDTPIDLSFGPTATAAAGVRLQVNADPFSITGYTGQVSAIQSAFLGSKVLAFNEETG